MSPLPSNTNNPAYGYWETESIYPRGSGYANCDSLTSLDFEIDMALHNGKSTKEILEIFKKYWNYRGATDAKKKGYINKRRKKIGRW